MNTAIALFRGINVGGKNKIKMKELAEVLENLGYTNIQTYIQSGNVVFQTIQAVSEKAAEEISRAIFNKKGFEPRVLLLTKPQFQNAIEQNPFPTDNGKLLHFYFLESTPSQPNLERIQTLKSETESFELTENTFYLYAPGGIGRSKLAASVEKALGVPATARNWNTVSKILTMIHNL
ncbi:MAG: DUF1697 domain-containing protein [Chloroflexota bacterium]